MLLLYGQVDLRAMESFYQLQKFFSRFYLTEKFCLRFYLVQQFCLGEAESGKAKELTHLLGQQANAKKKISIEVRF